MALQDIIKNIDPESAGLKVVGDGELKAIQQTLLTMVDDFAALCDRHGIEWSLFGGSVIGAVRHNGFVPWDDDIDIYITRDNYEKLRRVFDGELSQKYILKEPGRKNYLYHFPQMQLRGTEVEPIQTTNDANDGLFVDIFIMENAPDNKLLRTLHGLLCSFFLFADSAIRQRLCREHIFAYVGNSPQIQAEINKRARFAGLFGFMRFEKWLKLSDRCFSLCRNTHTRYIACPSGRLHYFKETYDRQAMCRYVKHDFEGRAWPIPGGVEYYLKKRYGEDYMQLPPADKREKHVYVKLNLHGNSRGDIE